MREWSLALNDPHLHYKQTMSRRSSRKVTSLPSYAEIDQNIDILSAAKVEETTPKKGRKVVIEEQIEATQSIKAAASKLTTPTRKSKTDKVDDFVVEAVGTDVKVKKSPAKRKINSEEPKPCSKDAAGAEPTEVISPKKTKAKRKFEIEGEIEQESDDKKLKKKAKQIVEEEKEVEEADTKKIKKRKTKEEKEAEAMPLAARTSIQTLKRAMYIGAHVSGAGGKYSFNLET